MPIFNQKNLKNPIANLTNQELEERIRVASMGGGPNVRIVDAEGQRVTTSPGGTATTIDYDPLIYKAYQAKLRQAKRDEENEPRKVYEARIKEIDDEYDRKTAQRLAEYDQNVKRDNERWLRLNLQKQVEDIDREISSTKGWKYGQEPESKEYIGDLERKKAGILNAMLGKGIDISEAYPQAKVKESYRTTQDPFGGIVQVDSSGKIVHRIAQPKPEKKEKAKPNYLEAAQIKAATELIKEAYKNPEMVDPEMISQAQKFLGQMQMKYGKGISTELPEEDEDESETGQDEGKKERTVVRSGIDKKTGKKVIQYDDGSLEYAS